MISADSRQVYIGMDIITGKELPPVWLVDVCRPDEKFNVADFVRLATAAIQDIWRRGKLPILVGGTGFYLRALIDGIGSLGVKPNAKIRTQLEKLTVIELQGKLKAIDRKRLERMNSSDKNNPRRLIRAIEIAKSTDTSKPKSLACDLVMIGLKTTDYQTLYERINQRVKERVGRGAIGEVQRLLKKGYSWENSVLSSTIGYRQFQDYFENKASLGETIQHWQFAEHAYARRQMSWFKKEKRILWFNIGSQNYSDRLEKEIRAWYHQTDAKKD